MMDIRLKSRAGNAAQALHNPNAGRAARIEVWSRITFKSIDTFSVKQD